MYEIGEMVMYGVHGVCTVVDVEERKIDRKLAQYLVLQPKEQSGSRFYVPMANANAMAKLRPMLTLQQLEELLASDAVRQDCWIADENQRKQCYRELIAGGDRTALLQMVRTLYTQKQVQISQGRKFHLCDENFLRDAQKLLSTEFSVILGIPQAEVGAYVLSKLSD